MNLEDYLSTVYSITSSIYTWPECKDDRFFMLIFNRVLEYEEPICQVLFSHSQVPFVQNLCPH